MRGRVFLVNPASDNGATGKRWPELAHRAAGLGLSGDALFSERPGHLTELARAAAGDGARLLVAVGGDGTVNEVVNGLAGHEAELAILPRGTGTDFVRTFGIPRRFDRAVEVAVGGEPRADRPRAASRPGPGTARRASGASPTSRARDERRDREAHERDDEGVRRQGVVPLGDLRRLRGLAEHGARGRRPTASGGARGCTTSSSRTAATSAAG